jgi:hypothetical protein
MANKVRVFIVFVRILVWTGRRLWPRNVVKEVVHGHVLLATLCEQFFLASNDQPWPSLIAIDFEESTASA